MSRSPNQLPQSSSSSVPNSLGSLVPLGVPRALGLPPSGRSLELKQPPSAQNTVPVSSSVPESLAIGLGGGSGTAPPLPLLTPASNLNSAFSAAAAGGGGGGGGVGGASVSGRPTLLERRARERNGMSVSGLSMLSMETIHDNMRDSAVVVPEHPPKPIFRGWSKTTNIVEDKSTTSIKRCTTRASSVGRAGGVDAASSENAEHQHDQPQAAQASSSPKGIRVVSYNILANRLVNTDRYPTCPPLALGEQYRLGLIREELRLAAADILVLTEISVEVFEAKASLGGFLRDTLNYSGDHVVITDQQGIPRCASALASPPTHSPTYYHQPQQHQQQQHPMPITVLSPEFILSTPCSRGTPNGTGGVTKAATTDRRSKSGTSGSPNSKNSISTSVSSKKLSIEPLSSQEVQQKPLQIKSHRISPSLLPQKARSSRLVSPQREPSLAPAVGKKMRKKDPQPGKLKPERGVNGDAQRQQRRAEEFRERKSATEDAATDPGLALPSQKAATPPSSTSTAATATSSPLHIAPGTEAADEKGAPSASTETASRRTEMDGVAIFYKKARFHLLESIPVRFNLIAQRDTRLTLYERKKLAVNTHNVALISVLQDLQNPLRVYVVAGVHLIWQRVEAQLWQSHELFKVLESVKARYSSASFIPPPLPTGVLSSTKPSFIVQGTSGGGGFGQNFTSSNNNNSPGNALMTPCNTVSPFSMQSSSYPCPPVMDATSVDIFNDHIAATAVQLHRRKPEAEQILNNNGNNTFSASMGTRPSQPKPLPPVSARPASGAMVTTTAAAAGSLIIASPRSPMTTYRSSVTTTNTTPKASNGYVSPSTGPGSSLLLQSPHSPLTFPQAMELCVACIVAGDFNSERNSAVVQYMCTGHVPHWTPAIMEYWKSTGERRQQLALPIRHMNGGKAGGSCGYEGEASFSGAPLLSTTARAVGMEEDSQHYVLCSLRKDAKARKVETERKKGEEEEEEVLKSSPLLKLSPAAPKSRRVDGPEPFTGGCLRRTPVLAPLTNMPQQMLLPPESGSGRALIQLVLSPDPSNNYSESGGGGSLQQQHTRRSNGSGTGNITVVSTTTLSNSDRRGSEASGYSPFTPRKANLPSSSSFRRRRGNSASVDATASAAPVSRLSITPMSSPILPHSHTLGHLPCGFGTREEDLLCPPTPAAGRKKKRVRSTTTTAAAAAAETTTAAVACGDGALDGYTATSHSTPVYARTVPPISGGSKMDATFGDVLYCPTAAAIHTNHWSGSEGNTRNTRDRHQRSSHFGECSATPPQVAACALQEEGNGKGQMQTVALAPVVRSPPQVPRHRVPASTGADGQVRSAYNNGDGGDGGAAGYRGMDIGNPPPQRGGHRASSPPVLNFFDESLTGKESDEHDPMCRSGSEMGSVLSNAVLPVSRQFDDSLTGVIDHDSRPLFKPAYFTATVCSSSSRNHSRSGSVETFSSSSSIAETGGDRHAESCHNRPRHSSHHLRHRRPSEREASRSTTTDSDELALRLLSPQARTSRSSPRDIALRSPRVSSCSGAARGPQIRLLEPYSCAGVLSPTSVSASTPTISPPEVSAAPGVFHHLRLGDAYEVYCARHPNRVSAVNPSTNNEGKVLDHVLFESSYLACTSVLRLGELTELPNKNIPSDHYMVGALLVPRRTS